MTSTGRFPPFSMSLRQRAMMLRCMRQKSAMNGRSPHSRKGLSHSRKRTVTITRQAALDAPKPTEVGSHVPYGAQDSTSKSAVPMGSVIIASCPVASSYIGHPASRAR